MRNDLAALFVGAIFGAGLVLSDMVNPARVQAFLDVAGRWDPTLMFVMGAALVPSALAYLVRRKLVRPVLASHFFVPENAAPDRRLLTGAALLGHRRLLSWPCTRGAGAGRLASVAVRGGHVRRHDRASPAAHARKCCADNTIRKLGDRR